jgi:glycerophosphoryl diester phosphodiesterase
MMDDELTASRSVGRWLLAAGVLSLLALAAGIVGDGRHAVSAGLTRAGVAPGVRAGARAGAAGVLSDLPSSSGAVVAHRGYSALAPENTMAAVRVASLAGTKHSWVDVRSTADGVPVLLADETLDRTTDCSGPVAQVTSEALRACDAGSWFDPRFAGERVPSVSELLSIREPDLRFTLMLHAGDIDAVLELIENSSAGERVGLASIDVRVLERAGARLPQVQTWLRAPVINRLVVEEAVDAGADGIAVDASGVRTDDVAAAKAEGLQVMAVGVPDERRAVVVVNAGVDQLTASRTEAMRWVLDTTFRTYGGASFDRANEAGHDFPQRLAVGDFDADGRDDLALSAPLDHSVVTGGGWVGVSHGGAGFPDRLFAKPGQSRDAHFGQALSVGDLDADGFDDLVIASPNRSFSGVQSGVLHLWSGSAGGVGGSSRPFGPSMGDGARMGTSLAAGDFDGDGVSDLAVGAPGVGVEGQAAAGRVVVLPGQRGAGPVTRGALYFDRAVEDVPGDPVPRERLGGALAAGDFDGDGIDELVVGVPHHVAPGAPDAGSVLLLQLEEDPDTGGLALAGAVEIDRSTEGIPGDPARAALFGESLVAADFDGDGFDDLLIGSPSAPVGSQPGAGDITVMYGSSAGLETDRAVVVSRESGLVPGEAESRGRFGVVLGVGDLDGDGLADAAIGSPTTRGAGQPEVGDVVVLFGARTGLSTRRVLHVHPALPNMGFSPGNRQRFGSAVAVCDLNGDGATDLAVAGPGISVDGVERAGALVVAWGPDDVLPGVPTATPRLPTETPTPQVSPTPTVTPRPQERSYVYLPYTTRLRSLDLFPTPVLPDRR